MKAIFLKWTLNKVCFSVTLEQRKPSVGNNHSSARLCVSNTSAARKTQTRRQSRQSIIWCHLIRTSTRTLGGRVLVSLPPYELGTTRMVYEYSRREEAPTFLVAWPSVSCLHPVSHPHAKTLRQFPRFRLGGRGWEKGLIVATALHKGARNQWHLSAGHAQTAGWSRCYGR